MKLKELPQRNMPEWLANIQDLDALPIRDLLNGSIYYPACGLDGRAIEYTVGFGFSYIYVDYGVEKVDAMAEMTKEGAFKGYKLLGFRKVKKEELLGIHKWNIHQPSREDRLPRSNIPELANMMGRMEIPTLEANEITPYCIWAVYDRLDAFDERHGPERFSLLYLCGDGAASYQALYYSNESKPDLITLICPGLDFGGAWTNFFDGTAIFARIVLGNPSGKPEFMLVDTNHGGEGFNWGDYETHTETEISSIQLRTLKKAQHG